MFLPLWQGYRSQVSQTVSVLIDKPREINRFILLVYISSFFVLIKTPKTLYYTDPFYDTISIFAPQSTFWCQKKR